MKHKTVETLPLRDDRIVLTVEKPVVRRPFAQLSKAHGKRGYSRKDFKNYEREET